MSTGSVIERLGFSANDRVIIFHIDDMGTSHASNVGSRECLDFGVASAVTLIVAAPWFMEAAEICKAHPNYDTGAEIALTCEYTPYRWRALSSADPATGLINPEGSMWRTVDLAVAHITPEAAEKEMRAQVSLALATGLEVSHFVAHMGTANNPKFVEVYRNLARELKVPRVHSGWFSRRGQDFDIKRGYVVEDLLDWVRGTGPGLTYLNFHPAKESEETIAMHGKGDWWKMRHQGYLAFTDPRMKALVEELDLKVIGYRHIRDCIRANPREFDDLW